jgi:hypothetical protein
MGNPLSASTIVSELDHVYQLAECRVAVEYEEREGRTRLRSRLIWYSNLAFWISISFSASYGGIEVLSNPHFYRLNLISLGLRAIVTKFTGYRFVSVSFLVLRLFKTFQKFRKT